MISASCQKNQIDINTASLEELDKLAGIGPVKAQAIINSRPFNKLDDLLNVVGIGDVTLSNIKQQGLACVSDEEEDGEEVADKVEERYARILRRREAARRAMRTRSSVRESGVRKPLSIVERKARLARAKREMMLRRRARLGR